MNLGAKIIFGLFNIPFVQLKYCGGQFTWKDEFAFTPLAPVGSFMTNRFGYRKCSLIGAIIASTGVSLGYFATGTPFLFVSHGFLTGT